MEESRRQPPETLPARCRDENCCHGCIPAMPARMHSPDDAMSMRVTAFIHRDFVHVAGEPGDALHSGVRVAS